MRQRENQREVELLQMLNNLRIVVKRVEGKGGSRGVLDLLCYTEKGRVFLLEVKDGSKKSIDQQVTLSNVMYSWEAKKENGKWIFIYYYPRSIGEEPISMALMDVCSIVNGRKKWKDYIQKTL